MSVINKMLRDLDKRKSSPKTAASLPDLSLRSGTVSVPVGAMSLRAAPQTRWRKVMLPGLVVILALLVWEWQTGGLDQLERVLSGRSRGAPVAPQPMAPPPEALVATLPAVAASGPVSAASAPQSAASSPLAAAPVPATAPVATVATATTTKTTTTTKFEPALVLPPVKPVAALPPPAAAAPVVKPAAVEQVLTKGPAASSATAVAPATASSPAAADPGQRQLQAARDAVAHAQSLWNTGSKESALDLMQQAVASTERAATAAPSVAATQSLVLLAREQSRILLAEGKAGAVWDLMVRLEPLFKGEPDMWAMRANAAQRLGRHQDSVYAYMAALQSRPNEQRWLLGAAVSLAALGQTVSAADMADKARAVGTISRDVQTYLRQMGVPVKD